MQLQRDRALAAMVLGASVALAVLLSVVVNGDARAIAGARAAAAVHEKLLREAQGALRQNLDARDSVRAALEAVMKNRGK